MKTTYIIVALVLAIATTFSIIIYNAFGFKRKFVVLNSSQYNICFLVNSDLQYEIKPGGFKYWGGKNSGEFTLERSGFMDGLEQVPINGFNAGYKKIKNFRLYQYALDESGTVLTDRFQYVSKSPLNLVPYREDCEKIKNNYPDIIEIAL